MGMGGLDLVIDGAGVILSLTWQFVAWAVAIYFLVYLGVRLWRQAFPKSRLDD